MKNRILAVVGLALISVISAHAQNQNAFQVNVPFPFEAGNHLMPAGRYVVKHINREVVRLQGPGGVAGAAMVHLTISQKAPNHGSVVFRQVGNRFFLAEIWSGGQTNGEVIFPGQAENEAMAALKSGHELKQVALNILPALQNGQ